jgi:hypothetical protein
MLIDRYLPDFDVTEVHEVEVDAPPEVTFDAIRKTELRDPLIHTLFGIRELSNPLVRKLSGTPMPPRPRTLTFADIVQPEMGWIPLAEDPGIEFVIGSVGRFWRKDYGWRLVKPADFAGFGEPGYAKLALGFLVQPAGFGRSTLRYEARTGTTDETARKRFRRYWRVIRPGVALVMRRALRRIKVEAEWQQSSLLSPR